MDYRFDPENKNSSNCVADCVYYYYISYGQYKCTNLPQCPDESNLLIRKKRKCIQSCAEDEIYKYQYNGECYEICPNDTIVDKSNHLCKIPNVDSCTQSSNQFELYNFLKEGGVEKIAKIYSQEFNYTNKHISLYVNEVYSIMLYKNKDCISELGLPMPEIDFLDCYTKVKNSIGMKESDLIVAIIDKKSNKKPNPITSYAFYNPKTGEKLNSEIICKEDNIIVKENIKSLLNENKSDIDSILYLAGQNIDIFNKSSEFYTSICYHFNSPCNKDIALRDRLLVYYPNITLCDQGCKNKGVNLTSMMALCECKFKDLNEENTDEDTNIYKEAVNTVNKILEQVNLGVMECYQDLFKYEYFISNTGGFILLVLICVQISTLVYYYFSSIFFVNKYIYNITENYLLYLNKSPLANTKVMNCNKNNNENNNDNNNSSNQNLKYPPKKIPSDIFDINHSSSKNSNTINSSKKVKIKAQDGQKYKISNKLSSKHLKKQDKPLIHKVKSNNSFKKDFIKNELSLKSNVSTFNNRSSYNSNFDEYLSTDINDMHFHDVAIIDNRLFFDYFCDKLKKKQLILQLFIVNSPVKPISIKILFLILDIEVCLVVNAMFINEDYVSELFHSKKKETFISFIPRSINRFIYTIFASVVLSYVIGCLFVEENKIKGVLKREKNDITNLKYQINIVMKEIKIRNNIFIIIAGIFSIFSWYYISCFNNIYPHMKNEWIKSSLFIIILIHILSIIIILIETLLRFVSFEIKSEKMYKASLWLG